MDTQRWRRVDEVFNAALIAAPSERSATIRRECRDDAPLRDEIESLLIAHERGSSVLDSPAFDAAQRPGERASLPAGMRLGRYTVLGVIGRGASGVVYEARQDEPERTVALKVVRASKGRDGVADRLLAREAGVLARLQHAGIAAIYESGSDGGWQYFAMERVKGTPINQHAQDHALTLRQRLDLMRHLCDAVQHAHERGVIHGDLKPSNILVTESGAPKVLDFGLARMIGQDAPAPDAAGFRGTLAYASPEQAAGHETDTRSDVYALGVVMFELLTGRLPRRLEGLRVHEAVRLIVEEPPHPLSEATLDAALARRLRGDLEAIVSRSLDADPAQRYRSAGALGEDLDRHLRGVAVEARRHDRLYLFRTALRCHWRPVAAAAVMMLVLSGAAVGTEVQRRHAVAARDDALEQRRLAETRERLAEELNASLTVLLTARGDLRSTVPEFRDAVARARAIHPDQPLHLATLLTNYGVVLNAVGEPVAAERAFAEALDLQRRHGGRSVEYARASAGHGSALATLGRREEAVAAFRQATTTPAGVGPAARERNAARIGLAEVLLQMELTDEAQRELATAWNVASDPSRPLVRQAKRIAGLMVEVHAARERADPGHGHAAREQQWREIHNDLPTARN